MSELFSLPSEQITLESYKKIYGNKDFGGVAMPSEDTKVLEFDQHQKSNKTLSIICADLEPLIKRIDACKNNSEKASTTKIGEHMPFRYSMYMIWTFDGIDNKHDVYRGEGYRKKFCESYREHIIKILYFEKKKIRQNAGIVWKDKNLPHFQKSSKINKLTTKIIVKLKTTAIIFVNTGILHIAHVT